MTTHESKEDVSSRQDAQDDVPSPKKPASGAVRLLAILLIVYLFLVCCLFTFQRSLLFFPTHEKRPSGLEPWMVEGQVIGYQRPSSQHEFIWLMLHGNAGQAADRDYALNVIPRDDTFFVLEYPGYGSRTGTPSKDAFDDASRQAYRHLRAEFPNSRIGVIGESLGTGPASVLATETEPPDKIVLITPFDSLANVAANRFPMFPVRFLLLDQWDNAKALQNYGGQVIIYAATNDEIIPFSHAERLASQLPNALFHANPGGHNQWSSGNKFRIEH